MNYQSQLSDSLMEQNQLHVQLPNFLFESGKSILIKKNQIKIILSIIKCFFGMVLIILKFIFITEENNVVQQQQGFTLKDLELWLYFTAFHSLIAMIQYKVIQKYLNKYSIILSLAIDMDLVNIIAIEQGLDQQQQQLQIQEQNDIQNQQLIGRLLLFDQRNIFVSKLSQEIYERLFDKFKCLKILNKLLILVFFFIEFFALLILFDSYKIQGIIIQFYYSIMVYMILVVLIGINQYFSTFALIFLWIVFLPVFLSYEIYKWCKRRKQQKVEKNKILNHFEEIMFDQSKHQIEDNQCAICMQNFQDKEKVIILPCSDKHIFHTDCIIDWLKQNINCPLCRKQVIDQF